MPALRTRVSWQGASTGASLGVPHAFFSWKSRPLAQQWVNELSHHPLRLGDYPCAQSRALRTTSPASRGWYGGTQGRWGILAAGQHRVEAARSSAALPPKSGWEQQINCLPLLSQSQVLHQKRWRIKILANCPLLSPLPEAQQQNRQGTKIFFHRTKLDAQGPSLTDRQWEMLDITSFTWSPFISNTVPDQTFKKSFLGKRTKKSYIFDLSTLRRPLGRLVRNVLCRLNMGVGRSGRCATNTCCLDGRDVQGGGRSACRRAVLDCRPRQNMSSAANRRSRVDRCNNFHSSPKV